MFFFLKTRSPSAGSLEIRKSVCQSFAKFSFSKKEHIDTFPFPSSLKLTLRLFLVSSSALADSLERAAQKISAGAKKLANKRVAVLPFPYHDGRPSKGSTIISERLTTCLVQQRKLEVIERSLLENVFKELKLQAT